jgi:glycosyltransferase involved in cell wall biosynthesis
MTNSTIKSDQIEEYGKPEECGDYGLQNKCSSNMPLISVVIPVFNGANSLEAAIKSVINQQYKNIELIIIDGKSNDGTVETIRRYEASIDYWVSEGDEGVYDAMNKGVNASHGDWIYFMGADIPFESDFIDVLTKHMRHQLSFNYLLRKKLKVVTRKVKSEY